MARTLERLGRLCARNRRWVYGVWAIVAVATVFLGVTGGGTFVQQDRLPGTETQRSIDLLKKNFSDVTGPTATVVFHPRPGVSLQDWRVAVQVGQAIKQIAIGTDKAKGICAACPVRSDCLAHAVVNGERDGIWGGLTEEERPKNPKKRSA